MIQVKRAFEAAAPEDGCRLLVDRLWPRGVSKAQLKIDSWYRDVAPSGSLRRWFGHSPEKWLEFRRRYFSELNANPGAWAPILDAARQQDVTLLFAARDPDHNNAIALRDYLLKKLRRTEAGTVSRPRKR